ncbi:MAG: response regulator [Bacillota bacterium]|nr:response regulator [Bacillota bacterium]
MHHILIVDDEYSLRITVQALLQKAGYAVDAAENATAALDLIAANDYDVILTDIIMPRMDGIELLSYIRRRSQTVQVLIMTGEPTIDTAMQAVKIGASEYLPKPIDKETLLIAVRQAVQIKNLNDEKICLEQERIRYLRELEQTVATRTRALQDAMQSIMLLCSSVIEVRDPYTAGHQRKVGNLSAAIANKMKLSNEFINNILMTGYLHDIGKMSIPAEILNKPGRLSNQEMDLIRIHPQQGYDMLRHIRLPKPVCEAIFQHHERLDGSGYPRQLMKPDILLESSILAVADVVEAMMSHRPYRPALGLDCALYEISTHAGRLYDSSVVHACISLFQEDRYTIDDNEQKIEFAII